jgi:palmitoyltransferase
VSIPILETVACHVLTAYQYLGPSALQLSHLFVLVVVNSLVLFGLILLLGRSVWGLALNMTTIESWEVERHHALLRRARVLGGQLDGPDGTKVRIEHQEFPWDVGILSNFRQAMGTWNLLAWGWPFASSPSIESGLVYEHNEIDGKLSLSCCSINVLTPSTDPSKPWPPPDPDRVYRAPRPTPSGDGFTQSMDIDEFRKRQEADLQRRQNNDQVVRRRPFHERYAHLAQTNQTKNYYDHDDDDDAVTSGSEADEEIQSPEAAGQRSAADEGEEA